jgi:hypothetical protein
VAAASLRDPPNQLNGLKRLSATRAQPESPIASAKTKIKPRDVMECPLSLLFLLAQSGAHEKHVWTSRA